MKLMHSQLRETGPQKKSVPLYKEAVAGMVRQISIINNEEIDRTINNGKIGLPLTKREQSIYDLLLKK